MAVGVEDEVGRGGLGRPPGGGGPERREVAAGGDAVEQPEVAQQRPRGGRQRLAGPRVAARRGVDEQHAAARCGERDRRGGAGRAAAGDERVEHRAGYRKRRKRSSLAK